MYNNKSLQKHMDNNKILTEAEEMYLVTIRENCEHCTDVPVSVPQLALELGIQPVSASQMINKLAKLGYVNYTPYKGVELTEEGYAVSTRILRHRRLWEVFFVDILQMELAEADNLACKFEHFTSADVADRLSEFLDNPATCFHGNLIPRSDETDSALPQGVPLHSLKMAQVGQVLKIEAPEATQLFLSDAGITPGVKLTVLAASGEGSWLVDNGENQVQFSRSVVQKIIVLPLEEDANPEADARSGQISLSQLRVGQKGIIRKLNCKGSLRQRLIAMGLVNGEMIMVKKVAPLGDPIEFSIKNYELSLRSNEAREVLIELI